MKKLVPKSSGDVGSSGVSVTEQVNLPAGSDAGDTPCTCLSHVGNVDYAIPDKNAGLMEKLSDAIFNCLSKNAD